MSEYIENNREYVMSDEELTNLLFERRGKGGGLVLKRSGLSRVSTVFALGRIKNLESQIRGTKDAVKKMDLLAKQNFYVGLLVSIAANSKLTTQ